MLSKEEIAKAYEALSRLVESQYSGANPFHNPVSGDAELAIREIKAHIAELEENATAQALALKAAKAMQQAETERADANERDAKRYRYIRTKERMMLDTDDGEARMTSTFSSAEEFDDAIDQAMRNP